MASSIKASVFNETLAGNWGNVTGKCLLTVVSKLMSLLCHSVLRKWRYKKWFREPGSLLGIKHLSSVLPLAVQVVCPCEKLLSSPVLLLLKIWRKQMVIHILKWFWRLHVNCYLSGSHGGLGSHLGSSKTGVHFFGVTLGSDLWLSPQIL